MSKYHSIKTLIDGNFFDSKKEATYYNQLKLRKRAGDIKEFSLQPRFDYHCCYTKNDSDGLIHDYNKSYFYKADFKVINNDGSEEIIDVKGVRTAEYKRKKKIVEALYGIKIIEK